MIHKFSALILAMVMALALALAGCAPAPAAQEPASPDASAAPSQTPVPAGLYTPGVYSASAFGMNGDVTVRITFDENALTDVQAVGEKETPGIGTPALEKLPAEILSAQSAEVDVLSGATFTSKAVLEAASACIAQAMGRAGEAEEEAAALEADVIVIGAGAAGLAAAAGAGSEGGSVIVLEANGIVGGSAVRSGGNLAVVNDELYATFPRNDEVLKPYLDLNPDDYGEGWKDEVAAFQQEIREYLDSDQAGQFDSVHYIMTDHVIKGSGVDLDGSAVTLDYVLIKEAIYANLDVYNWLKDAGLTIMDTQSKPHINTPSNKGAELVGTLEKLAAEAGAQIVLNTRAMELVMENGEVTGVRAIGPNGQDLLYKAAKGVIIATGSFSSNGEMCASYQKIGRGMSADCGSTNPETNVGDGIVMAQAAGAQLRDMQFISVMFKGYHNLASTGEVTTLQNAKQLAVNAEALRYCDDSIGSFIKPTLDQTDGLSFFVGDKAMYDAIEASTPGIAADLEGRGILFSGDTLEEAAAKAGLDPAVLSATVETFNGYVDAGEDADFGRKTFNGKVTEAPFVIVKLQDNYHLTFGGLVIDTDAHVLDGSGSAIPGLYAAGDVISAFEGDEHQSGNCMTIVIYYGRKAGINAVRE